MTIQPPAASERRDWRAIVFRVALVPLILIGAMLPISLPDMLSPWRAAPSDQPANLYHPEIHRFHDSQSGVMDVVLLAALLVSFFWRPRQKALIAQFIALTFVVRILAGAYLLLRGADPEPFGIVIMLAALALFIATYPARNDVLRFSGAFSRPLLGLTILAALGLSLDVARNVRAEIAGAGGEHFVYGHWVDAVVLAVLLVGGSLLAASRRPGWRILAGALAAAYLYLGVASLSLPALEGSYGLAGGIGSLVVGLLFLTATLRPQAAAQTTAKLQPSF